MSAKNLKPETKSRIIPPEQWGRDHASTFAYAMARVTGQGGKLEQRQMRCGSHHPGLQHLTEEAPPTRLRDNVLLHGHDDWDCIDDLVAAGLFKYAGTGTNPGIVYEPSELAWKWGKAIWAAEAAGKNWSSIDYLTSVATDELVEKVAK